MTDISTRDYILRRILETQGLAQHALWDEIHRKPAARETLNALFEEELIDLVGDSGDAALWLLTTSAGVEAALRARIRYLEARVDELETDVLNYGDW